MYEPSFAKFKTETLISRVENYPSVIEGVKAQIEDVGQEAANRPSGLAAYLSVIERDLRLIKKELARRGVER